MQNFFYEISALSATIIGSDTALSYVKYAIVALFTVAQIYILGTSGPVFKDWWEAKKNDDERDLKKSQGKLLELFLIIAVSAVFEGIVVGLVGQLSL